MNNQPYLAPSREQHPRKSSLPIPAFPFPFQNPSPEFIFLWKDRAEYAQREVVSVSSIDGRAQTSFHRFVGGLTMPSRDNLEFELADQALKFTRLL